MTIGTLAGHDGWAFAIDTAIDGTGLLGEVSVTVPGHQVTGSAKFVPGWVTDPIPSLLCPASSSLYQSKQSSKCSVQLHINHYTQQHKFVRKLTSICYTAVKLTR